MPLKTTSFSERLTTGLHLQPPTPPPTTNAMKRVLCIIGLISSSIHPSSSFSITSQIAKSSLKHLPSATSTSRSAGSFHDEPLAPSPPQATSSASTPLKKKDLRTLQRFLEVECWKSPSIRNLDRTLLGVSDACKQINRIVQRAQTDDLYGAAVDPVTGEFKFF